ncbi:MAG: hypothetical protein FWC89_02195 [Defluviitaleaceae bacterium]|nr:hypothetical protein [Defluviitaleaceae bacterium]
MKLNTLKYYLEEYHLTINGGGTFTRYELINLFAEWEKQSEVNKLKEEAKFLKDNLHYEDWEIEKNILNFIWKYGSRKSMNRLATDILTILTST